MHIYIYVNVYIIDNIYNMMQTECIHYCLEYGRQDSGGTGVDMRLMEFKTV